MPTMRTGDTGVNRKWFVHQIDTWTGIQTGISNRIVRWGNRCERDKSDTAQPSDRPNNAPFSPIQAQHLIANTSAAPASTPEKSVHISEFPLAYFKQIFESYSLAEQSSPSFSRSYSKPVNICVRSTKTTKYHLEAAK